MAKFNPFANLINLMENSIDCEFLELKKCESEEFNRKLNYFLSSLNF